MIRITLEWLPPQRISGNKRGSWKATAGDIAQRREDAMFTGLEYKQNHPGQAFPLKGDLALRYTFFAKTKRDWVNLAFGMKPFEDGLQDAGLFEDDYQIQRAEVVRRKGEPMTIVEIWQQ